jgi:hypothetical protein
LERERTKMADVYAYYYMKIVASGSRMTQLCVSLSVAPNVPST